MNKLPNNSRDEPDGLSHAPAMPDGPEDVAVDDPAGASGDTGLWQKCTLVLLEIRPFARRHLGLFSIGAVAAVGVVAARLALPWPLRTVTEYLTSASAMPIEVTGMDPVLRMGGLFLGLMLLLGFSDFVQRLYFARFAIGTTRDLRNAAFKKALGIDAAGRKAATGDLVSRLIGDTARLKAGLQGFLVHVATNGLLFLGATVVLFLLNAQLGMIFGLAGIAALTITVWGARKVFVNSLKHREKEGQLANKIQQSMTRGANKKVLKKINKSSSRYEAAQTRLQGLVTWATHGIFGIAVLAALWVGASAVSDASLAVGDMIVFMLYALMIQGPIVRLTRQGTRTGKILGPGFRLVQILQGPRVTENGDTALHLKSLKSVLRLTVRGEPGTVPQQIKIQRRKRLVLVCPDPATGTSLLETIAGRRQDANLEIDWDGISLRGENLAALSEQVRLVSFAADEPLNRRIKRLAKHYHDRASVWLFEHPLEGLPEGDATRLTRILTRRKANKRSSPAVVILTTRALPGLQCDSVIRIEGISLPAAGESE